MKFEDYKVVVYRQRDGLSVIAGCYPLMETREAALAERSEVFALIAEKYHEKGLTPPSDPEDLHRAERDLDRIPNGEEHTIPLEDVIKAHDVRG